MGKSTVSDFIEQSSNQTVQLNEKINQFVQLKGQIESVLSVFNMMHSDDGEESSLDVPAEMATRFESVAKVLSDKIDEWVDMNAELRDGLQGIQHRVISISENSAKLYLSQDLSSALDDELQNVISKLNSKFEELHNTGETIIEIIKSQLNMLQMVLACFVEGENIDKLDEILSDIEDMQRDVT